MRTLFTLLGLLSYFMTYAQTCGFETPEVFSSDYTDTGDANIPHELLDNPNEPFVNWPSNGTNLGFHARYEPYDDPDVGLTDGDAVGVTDATNVVGDYPEGTQGFVMSDIDGNFILEFDPVVNTSSNPVVSLHYFIAETGYEGDGTANATGSDRFRIYVRHLEENAEYDLLDTTGFDINDLGIEGQWTQVSVALPVYSGAAMSFQVVVEARNNSSSEAFYIDNLVFDMNLNSEEFREESLRLVPNPATDWVELHGLNSATPASIAVFDILGKKVAAYDAIDLRIPLQGLTSGMYFIEVRSSTKRSVLKLLKQ